MSFWSELRSSVGRGANRITRRGRVKVEKIDRQIEKTAHRDRTEPDRKTLRPAAAKRTSAAVPKPRQRAKPPSLRSRFRATRSTLPRGIKAPPRGGAPTYTSVRITARFSRTSVDRTVSTSYLRADKLDRWAAINAGQIPADDDTPTPPTPDQMDEAEREAMDQIQRWGRQEEAAIRDAAEEEREALTNRANQLDDSAAENDPDEARQLRQQADDLRDQAVDVMRDAQRAMDQVAEQVREQRSEARAYLRGEYERAVEQHQERLDELRALVPAEVEQEIMDRYFNQTKPDEIEEIELV